ncbi:hypothetical protein [Streptomyces monashensis]|uniref:hypothetical protein n=1 Tax=Streptomyces monashensis TaxID=1678012 RepID=UPI003F540CCF
MITCAGAASERRFPSGPEYDEPSDYPRIDEATLRHSAAHNPAHPRDLVTELVTELGIGYRWSGPGHWPLGTGD